MNAPLSLLGFLALTTASLLAGVAQEAWLKASNAEAALDNPLYETIAAGIEAGLTPESVIDFGERFGTSTAVSGDTIVIGAVSEHSGIAGDQSDDSQLFAGAAYVFVRTGSTWFQQAYLKASLPHLAASFGTSVSISGDTIVIGAPGESSAATGINGDESDRSAPTSGAAYVFVRSGTTWTQEAYLKASNSEAGDGFGTSVAIDGDTIVVGAPREDSAATGFNGDENDNTAADAGAAYIFSRSGTTWAQQRYLKASNTSGANPGTSDTGDRFGSAVAISGDTVAVGAPGEASNSAGINGDQSDDSEINAGAVYVFRKIGASAWVQQAYLKSSNPDGEDEGLALFASDSSRAGDTFGASLTIAGDLLVVGAPGEGSAATGIGGDQSDNSADGAGAAYVFSRSDTTWTQEAYLKASNAGERDNFGSTLSLSGTTLVVGAPAEDGISTGIDSAEDNDDAIDAGACYVFARPASTWNQLHYLKPSYLEALPESDTSQDGSSGFGGLDDLFQSTEPSTIKSFIAFGTAVAIDGTLLVAGAPLEDSAAQGINGDQTNTDAPNAGAAYVFDLDAQPPAPLPDIAIENPPGRDLVSQFSAVDFGLVGAGQSLALPFAAANNGGADLTGITIEVVGTHAADFSLSLTSIGGIPADASRLFEVTFTPTASGQREATLQVGSNDPDENPFTIGLTGIAVSQDNDQDGDGMPDLVEWKLRRIGFDWLKRQPGLVNYYYQTANSAGLYTPAQVGTLYAPSPIITPSPVTGKVRLTIDWKHSGDLASFFDFPADPSEVSVNTSGDIVFEFDPPSDHAFFRYLFTE